MARRVLVVDDEKGVREALRQLLEYEGIEVRLATSGQDALDAYAEVHPHLVLLDVKMAGMDGLETLRKLKESDPAAHIVMISGHGSIQTAVEATQHGAYDFLEKPLDTDRILLTVKHAFERVQLSAENERLRASVVDRYEIVGKSAGIRGVLKLIDQVAPTTARVLVTGENGTGKELVARAIHGRSPRSSQPFVEVNCAAIPGELIESELFGHMKGSFTGAFADRAGRFEQADGGTLFLDEIGDLSLQAQAKILRALQEGVVTRVGGSRSIKVDVRVIAATNKLLEDEIGESRFREDLFYRLNVVPIAVPPLRARREDIPLLVERFVAELAGPASRRMSPEAVAALAARDWPGNVRELRNTVERLLILASGDTVSAADVERLGGTAVAGGAAGGVAVGDLAHSPTFERFKQDAERSFLAAKLEENDWNVSETARKLDMPRSNLYKKIERYGLQRG
ncbi:MAG: sigma-54-dependent Fis family transcriptional regulator [Gemmatimonadetes bacterium]|nr:sigma-54-dependent Fis family transcriptional regulator [Gemmatimonadota bacterium]